MSQVSAMVQDYADDARRHFSIVKGVPLEALCEVCGGAGVYKLRVELGHPDWNKVLPCPKCEAGQEIAERQRRKRFTNFGVPSDYAGFRLGQFNMEGKQLALGCMYLLLEGKGTPFTRRDAALRMGVDRYNDQLLSNWVVLYGDFGRGKTALAAALCNELGQGGEQSLFMRMRAITDSVQQSYKADAKQKRPDVIADIIKPYYVVLDECTMETTPDKQSILEEILRARQAQKLPTVITTNWDKREFYKNWGAWAGEISNMAHWVAVAGVKLRPSEDEDSF